jgi:hypothetical protein
MALVLALSFVWSVLGNTPTFGARSVQRAQDFDRSPVCPDRPLYVQPTEATVKDTGLTLEVLCIVGGTYLERDLPGPGESADLLRRYLEDPPYDGLGDEAYVALMEEAVRLWPESRFARAGLARAILRGHRERTIAEKRRAAPEYLKAAEVAFAEGKVRYVSELAHLLGDLGDRENIERICDACLRTHASGTRTISFVPGIRPCVRKGRRRACRDVSAEGD